MHAPADELFSAGILSQEDVAMARDRVNQAFNTTQQELQGRPSSPSALLRRLKFPSSGTVELLKAAEVFEQAVEMVRNRSREAVPTGVAVPELSPCELSVLANLSGMVQLNQHLKRRTLVTGSLSNIHFKFQCMHTDERVRGVCLHRLHGVGVLPVNKHTIALTNVQ